MKLLATVLGLALTAVAAAGAVAADSTAADSTKRDDPRPAAPAPRTPAEIRAELYDRLAASKDADETEGLVGMLVASYSRSGSDTGDLLLQRARKAIDAKDYDAAEKILNAAIGFMPDQPAPWNARATLRFLDDDYDGSMADIAQTLKREPRHIGALMGMATILKARDKKKEAVEVYERVLSIAPHWKDAETAADKVKAEISGQEL
jgi:tetratricopeptide (TPR) repeat protein